MTDFVPPTPRDCHALKELPPERRALLEAYHAMSRACDRLYGDNGVIAVRAHQILRDALPESWQKTVDEHPNAVP